MSTFTLKCLALALMVIDHIGLYFEDLPGAVVLRLLGRISYPLFLFCMVWGYHYTRSRKKFLLRLYLMSVAMTLFRCWIDATFNAEQMYGNHDIFISLFWVGVLISAIELIQTDRNRGIWLLGIIFLSQLAYYFVVPGLFPILRMVSGDIQSGLTPNLALNEYGFAFVALGVAMYFVKERRELLMAVYVIFCIYQFSEEMLLSDFGFPLQWFMVLALPFMLRYNGEKGRGMKWFFYFFYPAHTFLLFYLANFVF